MVSLSFTKLYPACGIPDLHGKPVADVLFRAKIPGWRFETKTMPKDMGINFSPLVLSPAGASSTFSVGRDEGHKEKALLASVVQSSSI